MHLGKEIADRGDRVEALRSESATTPNPLDVTLVLADRSPLMIEGMKHVVASEPGFRILATCSEDHLIPPAVYAHQPDVLVLSMSAGAPEFDVLETLHADRVGYTLRTVLLADPLDEDDMVRAMQLGVSAIVLKDLPPSSFVRCIRKVHAGGGCMEHNAIGKIVERMLRRETAAVELSRTLTPREIEIMRLLATGVSNREIGDRLYVSEGTVKTHLHHIYEKLHVSGRMELTFHARDKGWM